MLILKMMNHNGRVFADDSPYAEFRLIQIPEHIRIAVLPINVPEGQVGNKEYERFNVELYDTKTGEVELLFMTGTVYVMNENGKTIATHEP